MLEYHNSLKREMEQNEFLCRMLGFELDSCEGGRDGENVIRDIIDGREFCVTDTEHFCCKVGVASVAVDPSRTISKNPGCQSNFAWPQPPMTKEEAQCEDPSWISGLQGEMERMWKLFLSDEVELWLQNHKPKCLGYWRATHVV